MKLTIEQIGAVAYIFERANGNTKTDYENEIIEESGLGNIESNLLENRIVEGLNNGIYDGSEERISAYWALGKRFRQELIPTFKKWLQKELEENDAEAVYQILIALGNMEEPVFNDDRDGSSSSSEKELNLRDAKRYLENKN
jgi:hypothetical protein